MEELLKDSQLKYSNFIRQEPFTGDYPNNIEFIKPLENTVMFSQYRSMVSFNGTPLHSESFGFCTGFIIQKVDGLETYGAHMDEYILNKEQRENVEKLPEGDYVGRFIRGTLSRDVRREMIGMTNSSFLKIFLKNRNISILSDIIVNTKTYHWALVYRPESHLLQVKSVVPKIMTEFDFLHSESPIITFKSTK
jgi:hypothetical protein